MRGTMPKVDDAPGYWMYETTGRLRPAIVALLNHGPLSAAHVILLRAYFRQWIMAPGWNGVDDLRARVDDLVDRDTIERWLDDAERRGIDPL